MASKSTSIRAQIPSDVDFLIRAIAPLLNSNKDWSVSDIVSVALQEWLNKPEIQEIIDQHNLKLAFEKKKVDS
jgi:hypothetical protein